MSGKVEYYLVDGHPYRLDRATLKAEVWNVKKSAWNPIEDAKDVLYNGRLVDAATVAKITGGKP